MYPAQFPRRTLVGRSVDLSYHQVQSPGVKWSVVMKVPMNWLEASLVVLACIDVRYVNSNIRERLLRWAVSGWLYGNAIRLPLDLFQKVVSNNSPGMLTFFPNVISEADSPKSGWYATLRPKRTKGRKSNHLDWWVSPISIRALNSLKRVGVEAHSSST